MSVVAQQAFARYFGPPDRGPFSEHDFPEDAETADPMVEIARKSTSKWAAIETHTSRDSTNWLEPQARIQKYLNVHVAKPVQVREMRVHSLSERQYKAGRIVGIVELTHAVRETAAPAELTLATKDQGAGLQRKFRSLSNEWREATKYTSSSTEIVMNDAYQRIIGLGPSVIPLVLAELRDQGGHWFWALRALTGENPVALEDAGRVKKMTQAWLEWGQRKGLI